MSDKNPNSKKILLVEDEPMIIELITLFLKSHGYEITNVIEGDRVIQKTRELKPDLIILDIMLPTVNGFEICRQLKSDPALKTIPILILSALVQKGEIEMGIRMGADLYMTKPFQNEDLLRNIKKLLNEK